MEIMQRSNITGHFSVTRNDDGSHNVSYQPSELFKQRNFAPVILTVTESDVSAKLDEFKNQLVNQFNDMSPIPNYRIYGRYQNQKSFRAMNIREGKQVSNLIYASLFTKDEGEKCLADITAQNPEWNFELRHV